MCYKDKSSTDQKTFHLNLPKIDISANQGRCHFHYQWHEIILKF